MLGKARKKGLPGGYPDTNLVGMPREEPESSSGRLSIEAATGFVLRSTDYMIPPDWDHSVPKPTLPRIIWNSGFEDHVWSWEIPFSVQFFAVYFEDRTLHMGGPVDSITHESQNTKWLMAAERTCATLWIDKGGLGLYRQWGVLKIITRETGPEN